MNEQLRLLAGRNARLAWVHAYDKPLPPTYLGTTRHGIREAIPLGNEDILQQQFMLQKLAEYDGALTVPIRKQFYFSSIVVDDTMYALSSRHYTLSSPLLILLLAKFNILPIARAEEEIEIRSKDDMGFSTLFAALRKGMT